MALSSSFWGCWWSCGGVKHFAGPCEMPRWNKYAYVIKLLQAATLDAAVIRQNCMKVGG